MEKGRLQTDVESSVLVPSDEFKKRLKMSIPAAHRLIVQDLNGLLRKLPPVFWYGLPEAEVEQEGAGTLSDSKTKELRVFTGSWADFLDKYKAWRAEMRERKGEGDLLETLMSMAQGPDSGWGALRFRLKV